MNLVALLVLFLFPWNPGYYDSVLKLETIYHEYPCDARAWTGPDNKAHLCLGPEDGTSTELFLHESQHILAGHALPPRDWEKFRVLAMKVLRNKGYTGDQLGLAKYYATYGGAELHAHLPWITHGKLPTELQPWYPWFYYWGAE